MVAGDIEATVKAYLVRLDQAGVVAAQAVVFGSQANGTAAEGSDIDIIVISTYFDENRNHRAAELLWVIKSRVDHRLEPIPCGLEEWQNGSDRPIIEIARQQGIPIQPESA